MDWTITHIYVAGIGKVFWLRVRNTSSEPWRDVTYGSKKHCHAKLAKLAKAAKGEIVRDQKFLQPRAPVQ